jgi:hypothetical protein
MILKWIIEVVRVWTGCICLRIGANGSSSESGNKLLVSIKGAELRD